MLILENKLVLDWANPKSLPKMFLQGRTKKMVQSEQFTRMEIKEANKIKDSPGKPILSLNME